MIGDSSMFNKSRQDGAASLFIVIFTTLIILIITVSFIRLMINDQQQASANDLSQSAFDSAQAGVEDAKRVIIRYQNICMTSVNPSDCTSAFTSVTDTRCNYANQTLTDAYLAKSGGVGSEVRVQKGSTTNNFDQAYTCVKINLDTNDFIGNLKQDESKMVPLVGVSNFNSVKIEWFTQSDLQGNSGSIINAQSGVATPLLAQDSWTTISEPNRPAIMRTQLIQYGTGIAGQTNGFLITDFNANKLNTAYNSTMFLYPSLTLSSSSTFPTTRRESSAPLPTVPKSAKCSSTITAGGYACSITLTLPMTVSAGTKSAFLNLKALYKKTHYRITLSNSGTSVMFHSVQPEVDSTGRANDLFRRISSRIELGDTSFPFPEAAVDLTGNFCKNFMVTDKFSDYENNCTP